MEGIRDCMVSLSRCEKLNANNMGNTVWEAVSVAAVSVATFSLKFFISNKTGKIISGGWLLRRTEHRQEW